MYSLRRKFKTRVLTMFMLVLLTLPICSTIVFADDLPYTFEMTTAASNTGGGTGDDDTALDQDSSKSLLISMFGTSVWSGTNVAAGVGFAKPFVRVIMTLCIAIVVIVCFLFFGVTALDLTYIIVPITRPLLMKGKESMGDKTGGKFCCISDSAVEAVEGKGGGGMGGGDRGVGSCLTKYVSSRTVEFVVFILFCMLFFTGMLGNVVIMLFNLMYSILEAIMNLA